MARKSNMHISYSSLPFILDFWLHAVTTGESMSDSLACLFPNMLYNYHLFEPAMEAQ